MDNLHYFQTKNFIDALKSLFKSLDIPINYLEDRPIPIPEILGDRYNPNSEAHSLIKEIYALGLVNDRIFKGESEFKTISDIQSSIQSDYDGLLIFGITLHERQEGLLPTRSQLADITRLLNRTFPFTPVTIVFQYSHYITLANSERTKYTQAWREGEKLGKVILLKDIDVDKTHSGHLRILGDLRKTKEANSFSEVYTHWQKVLNTKELNKKFFKKIANWYFWAVAKSKFPYEYLREDEKNTDKTNDELQSIANQKAVIRFITRIIFVWFLKEKKLIPDNLFDVDFLAKTLKKFNTEKSSDYFQAILQNLFFATLNRQPELRDFALDKGFFHNRNTDFDLNALYRYEKLFKNQDPEYIMSLFKTIPFLNGGLFDSLDDKTNKTLIDGFSRTKSNQAKMPDELFFSKSVDFDTELREIYSSKKEKYDVKGLFEIFGEYKFTIEENTPLETDIALDPYLLGEIFENLLAYYNPETGTTARKGSGSFYTPQEIVNYMVSESLKSYLNTQLEYNIENLDDFEAFDHDQKFNLVKKLAEIKILDPACGSGAFPMGILYKMVDILKSLDPDNTLWREVQRERIIGEKVAELKSDSEKIANLSDSEVKAQATQAVQDRLDNLEAFFNNEYYFDDYKRKLFIIQNCIYGVDIQDVAIQISKLRFFLSLIIDQDNKDIQPLPNLETKFVVANTLIGIDLPKNILFGTEDNSADIYKSLKDQLREVRKNHFSATDRKTKLKLKDQDAKLREQIANSLADSYSIHNDKDVLQYQSEIISLENQLLDAQNLPDLIQEVISKDMFGGEVVEKVNIRKQKLSEIKTKIKLAQTKIETLTTDRQASDIRAQATRIAAWDIYNQNAHADWFDPDWMFGIEAGFDVVIGNPPYVTFKGKEKVNYKSEDLIKLIESHTNSAEYKVNSYALFIEDGYKFLKLNGIVNYIIPSTILQNEYLKKIRKHIILDNSLSKIISFENKVFEAVTDSIILITTKNSIRNSCIYIRKSNLDFDENSELHYDTSLWNEENNFVVNFKSNKIEDIVLNKIESNSYIVEDFLEVYVGIVASGIKKFLSFNKVDSNHKKYLQGKHIGNYLLKNEKIYINFLIDELHSNTDEKVYKQAEKILIRKTGNILLAYLDKEQYYTDQSIYNLYPKKGSKINLTLFTGLFNSKLLNFYFNKKMITNIDVFPYIKGIHLKQLPIKLPADQTPFITLVDQILAGKKTGQDTTALEHQIDVMVYHLYELSYEEAQIIDPALSEEDWERYGIG